MLKKFSYLYLIVILISSCAKEEDNSAISETPSNSKEEDSSSQPQFDFVLADSKMISEAPFSKPRESIVYKDDLYVIDESATYKYDFTLNSWEVIYIDNEGIAVYPFLRRNLSFIRDSKWYLINEVGMSSFDFETSSWNKVKEFNNSHVLLGIAGFYEKETLFIFSDRKNIMYKYDFNSNELIEHSLLGDSLYYGGLENPILKIGNYYYYLKLTQWHTVAIYKFNDEFTSMEFLNEYETDYLAHGISFAYEDKIVFGLGGEHSRTEEGILSNYEMTDKFSYYDTTKNEFQKVGNAFYEGRYLALPLVYDDKYYLLGGLTIKNNTVVFKNSLDILKFNTIIN